MNDNTQTIETDDADSTETNTRAIIELSSQSDEHHFDMACLDITHALNNINPDSTTYTSHGTNVGWRNSSGTTDVEIEDAQDLIYKMAPSGSWNMVIEETSTELIVTLSHHDSPTGETHRIQAK